MSHFVYPSANKVKQINTIIQLPTLSIAMYVLYNAELNKK